MRSPHDMGGDEAGPIPLEDHPWETWEKRANALIGAMRARGLSTLDAARRNQEQLGDAYTRYGYWQRTMHSAAQMALEAGLITSSELAATLERIEREEAAAGSTKDGGKHGRA